MQMFKEHSVAELRILSKKISADIERKKQDLREMVGERYRDLIDSSDKIQNMQVSSENVESYLNNLMILTKNYKWKDNKLETESGKSLDLESKVDTSSQKVYSTAALLKLLIDTPEQIWNAFEHFSYLKASHLFLLSREVYKLLSTKPNMNLFPVIQRQWEVIAQFKTQILDKAKEHIKSFKLKQNQVKTQNFDPKDILETILAIMILSLETPKHMLELLLVLRTESIQNSLASENSEYTSPLDVLKRIVDIVNDSITAVQVLFDNDRNDSLFQQLKKLKLSRGENTLNSLIFDRVNSHIIFKHLPSSIKEFSPFTNVTTLQPQDFLSLEELNVKVHNWLETITDIFKKNSKGIFSSLALGEDISSLRDGLLDYLSKSPDERGSILSNAYSDQKNISKSIQNQTFTGSSLWKMLFRETINNHAVDIMNAKFVEVVSKWSALSKQPIKNENFDAQFIWNQNTRDQFENEIHSDLISEEFCSNFFGVWHEMKLDLTNLCTFNSHFAGNKSDILLHQQDIQLLSQKYRELANKSIKALQSSLNDVIESPDVALEDLSMIGRSGKIIEKNCVKYSSLFSVDFIHKTSDIDMNGVHIRRRNTRLHHLEPLAAYLKETSNLTHISAYQKWILMIRQSTPFDLKGFCGKLITSMNDSAYLWECTYIPITVEIGDAEADEKVLIPCTCSRELYCDLRYSVSLIIKHLGFEFHKDVSEVIQTTYAEHYLKIIESLLVTLDTLSERHKIQYYFDVRFIMKLFEYATKSEISFMSRFKSLESKLEYSIDPIDFSLMRPFIITNVNRLYSRMSILLEPLLSLNSKIISTKNFDKIDESPHVLNISLNPSRFGLFPLDEITIPDIGNTAESNTKPVNKIKRKRIQIKLVNEHKDIKNIKLEIKQRLDLFNPDSSTQLPDLSSGFVNNKTANDILGVASSLLVDFWGSSATNPLQKTKKT